MSTRDTGPDVRHDGAERIGSKPKWSTPVLSEEAIGPGTQNHFTAGIDIYERSNPVGYGS